MEAEVVCPYCGEVISVSVDEGGGRTQRYLEDCTVCCRPIELAVDETEEGDLTVVPSRTDQ